jgi:xylulokinase
LALQDAVTQLHIKDLAADSIMAISVDSTSGTIVPIDTRGAPLSNAIMYNDDRAQLQGTYLNGVACSLTEKLGYKFNASFALAKIMWIRDEWKDVFSTAWKFIHAADFITGRLCGNYSVTDNTNALKTGYDLVDNRWPQDVMTAAGIPLKRLPEVISPGEPIGNISADVAEKLGLSTKTVVVAGLTDGNAGFVASGAKDLGEWNSTLGTTLVVRGVCDKLIKDTKGRIYCHRHPCNFWLPGGASNVGADCLVKNFPDEDLDDLSHKIEGRFPTGIYIYPLTRRGERFPFVDPDAEKFIVGDYSDRHRLFAAYLEGVGYTEKLIYQTLESLGCPVSDRVYATGGGSKNKQWLRIRSSILNKELIVPEITECVFGAAIVAASRVFYNDVIEATSQMVRIADSVQPDRELEKIYGNHYNTFIKLCKQRFKT